MRFRLLLLLTLLGIPSGVRSAHAQDSVLPLPRTLPEDVPTQPAGQLPTVLTQADALRWAMYHNPTLATTRKLHGIADAGILIARTYPFNPIVQDFVWGDNGPVSAGVTNHVFNEHTTRLDLELRGQGKYRRAMAQAALKRTDWEIATQEVLTGILVVRAFNTALYRQEKLHVQEDTIRLQEQVLQQVTRLVEQGQMPRTELMLARMDVADAQTALGPARSQLVVAWHDLRRLLGVVDGSYTLQGVLEAPPPKLPDIDLMMAAEQRRPDLRALQLAVKEANARLQLEIANRYGNPSIGPAAEFNETSVTFVGVWALWQIPIFNTRRGEIAQRKAEIARAAQAVDSMRVTIQQDVSAAQARLASAEELVNKFRNDTLPTLENTREALDKLFSQGEPGVTLARVIAIRTRYLQARGAYLDALFELSQARADLAAAIGDPSLALTCLEPSPLK